MHTTQRVRLTILEVVVSICWVAISIDMTGAPPTLPPLTEKSPLNKCPSKASPKVGGWVEPSLSSSPETTPAWADYSRAHFHVGQSITQGDEDSVWYAVIHSPGWALWECVLPGFSRSGCLSPPPPPSPLRTPLFLLGALPIPLCLTFHSLSISLIDSAPLQALSVFVSLRQVAFFETLTRRRSACAFGNSLPSPWFILQSYPPTFPPSLPPPAKLFPTRCWLFFFLFSFGGFSTWTKLGGLNVICRAGHGRDICQQTQPSSVLYISIAALVRQRCVCVCVSVCVCVCLELAGGQRDRGGGGGGGEGEGSRRMDAAQKTSLLIKRKETQRAEANTSTRVVSMMFAWLKLLDIGLQVTEVSAAVHQSADQFNQPLWWAVIKWRWCIRDTNRTS